DNETSVVRDSPQPGCQLLPHLRLVTQVVEGSEPACAARRHVLDSIGDFASPGMSLHRGSTLVPPVTPKGDRAALPVDLQGVVVAQTAEGREFAPHLHSPLRDCRTGGQVERRRQPLRAIYVMSFRFP